MSDAGPTPDDFAAARRPDPRLGPCCSVGCLLLAVGVALAAAGVARPVGELSVVVGVVVVATLVGVVLRSAVRTARRIGELMPRPVDALPALLRAAPDARGWLVLRVHAQPGGSTSWLAVTFTTAEDGRADARWLPGVRDDPTPGGRRVWSLAPDPARLLSRRLRTTLGPPAAVPAPVDVRDGGTFEVAACWSGGAPHRVRGNLSSTRPPEGDLWAELVEDGLALVDDARAT